MSRRTVEITTGSRLHFGMTSFGRAGVRQFGGAGLMVDAPGVRLRITPANQLHVTGPMAAQALRSAEAVAQAEWLGRRPNCLIEILAAPTPHVGLGSGTQLALAVAAGLNAFYDRRPLSSSELAETVARGRRSAIGLYGFLHGGLIIEAGKLSEDEISPLVKSVTIPAEWRFALVRPEASEGLWGDAERQAFERLPPVAPEVTGRMLMLADNGLAKGAADCDFELFSESLFRFGEEAGHCFAPLQGGIYASPRIDEVVQTLRGLGIVGVAQSSWGPTVCALLPSAEVACQLVERLPMELGTRETIVHIASPLNDPARIDVREE